MSSQPRTSKWLKGNPEWEAMKASSRLLRPHEAVKECAALSEQYRRLWRPRTAGMIDLDTVLRTLLTKKVPFVLTGTHGITVWTGQPRATHDVDILVKSGRNHARAVKALRAAYPDLEMHQLAGVTAFFLPGERRSVLDVTYPHRLDLEQTLETGVWVEERGIRYRVPALEAALANKYGAMLTLSREPDKRNIDAADFYRMVVHAREAGSQSIDLNRLRELGEMVWPGGGGAEILRLVEEVYEGKSPNLTPRGI